MFPNRSPKRVGITRIGLLVVIAILASVILLGLVGIRKAREQEATTQTMNNLKEVALALHKCNDLYKRLPPAWGPFLPPSWPGKPATGPCGTLHYWLLPFAKADDVYQQGQAEGAGANIWALPKVYSQVIPLFFSPSDFTTSDGTIMLSGATPWGAGNMAANTRVFGGLRKGATAAAWDNKARIPATFADGTSNTIAFATRYASCGTPPGGSAWAGGNTTASFANFMISGAFFGCDIEDTPFTSAYATFPPFQLAPTRAECDPFFAQAYSTAGIQVALADGTVRMVSPSISSKMWGEACHPSDGLHGGISTDWQ